MKTVTIGSDSVPAIGQGTWKMGTDHARTSEEISALRYGIEQGLTLIDTAEMYADGGAERVVGEAIHDLRDRVFVVTKVWPNHQSPEELPQALESSLKRLQIAQADLYLLHWPSRDYPLKETLVALAKAQAEGLTRYIGVSNFPTPYLHLASELIKNQAHLAVDQVEYQLSNRRVENALLPYVEQHDVALMAYSPVKDVVQLNPQTNAYAELRRIADSHGVPCETVALAYLIGSGPVAAIPKAVNPRHIDANRRALDLELSDDERQTLQDAFASPVEELPYQAL